MQTIRSGCSAYPEIKKTDSKWSLSFLAMDRIVAQKCATNADLPLWVKTAVFKSDSGRSNNKQWFWILFRWTCWGASRQNG